MNNSIYKIMLVVAVFITVFGVFAPKQAQAFDFGQLIDPACFFACDKNDAPRTKNVTNNYTNSNINSPGATVVDGSHYETPTYAYDYNHDYDYDYNEPLSISCYPLSQNVYEGETVRWVANVYGGNGSYHYSWSGTNSLSGNGSEVSKRYNTSGYKNATVKVTSGSRSTSRNCDATVYVMDDNNDRDYNYDYDYPNYRNLYVTCSVNQNFIQTGGTATWTAYPSGGDGRYTYSWSGTENLYGSGKSVYNRYNYTGQKTAKVTVYSDGQSVTRSCDNALTVGSQVIYQPNYPVYNNNDLDVGCYADPINPRINQPITWTVEVTGGAAPYTYSWTGTDGLSGNQSSVIKYYATTGQKSAIVSITSADGKNTTRACSHTVTVRPTASVAPVTQPPVSTPPATDNSLSAASLFSLQNIPWGWVAILVILVLFGTVLYLIFNKEKI